MIAGLAVGNAQPARLITAPTRPAAATAELAVANAQPVATGGPAPAPAPAPAPSPEPQPSPEAAPAPELQPVESSPVESGPGPIVAGVEEEGGSVGPGTAVVEEFGPIEACDGGDYGIGLLLYLESVLGGEAEATLAVHFAGEESEGTFYVEGVSLGVVELVDLLLEEGECLTITAEVTAPPE